MSSGVTNDPRLSFLDFDSQQDKRTAAEANRDHRTARRTRRSAARAGTERVVVPFWDGPEGEIWDRVTLNGRQFAGMAEITGKGPELKLDRRRARGRDGARAVSTGYEPAKVTIKLVLWTEDHLGDYELLLSELLPDTAPARRDAVDVYHPALALQRINRVIVTTIGLLKPGGEHGVRECEIECVQHREPDSRNATHRVSTNTRPIGGLDIDPRFRTERDDPATVTPPSAVAANVGP